MARRRSKRIDDPAQAAVLGSPVRMELLEHICAAGPISVRELADRMGRTPHALHYHVRQLLAADILEEVDSRRRGARSEAIYDVTADRFEIAADTDEPPSERAAVKVVRAALRRAERDYADLADRDSARLERDDVFAARLRAGLSVAARKEVRAHLRAIEQIFAREMQRPRRGNARIEPYTLTAVLLPEQ